MVFLCNHFGFSDNSRLGTNGILGSSLESLSPLKGFPSAAISQPRRASENVDPARRTCPHCMQNYEKEAADMLKEIKKSDSEVKSEVAQPPLPQWLQNAKTSNDQTQVKQHHYKTNKLFFPFFFWQVRSLIGRLMV